MEEIILFKSKDGEIALPVSTDGDTVWLSHGTMLHRAMFAREVMGKSVSLAGFLVF